MHTHTLDGVQEMVAGAEENGLHFVMETGAFI